LFSSVPVQFPCPMSVLKGSTDDEKLKDLSSKNYKAQSVWFLNSFWNSLGKTEAENVWTYRQRMVTIDKEKGVEGASVDEMLAHRFLELNKETLTVKELRDKLYSIGIERIKVVPLVYYLIFRYNVDWHVLVNASQGSNQEEVAQAQRMLDSVQKAFAEVQKTAEAASIREREAKQAKAEQDASLAEVQAQEKAYNDKTNDLTRKSETGGVVAQNKAKAELAAHLAENPLPLRRAKITNEAAVKKAEKAAQDAVTARAAAEAALEDAKVQVAKAEAYLQELMSKPGSAAGALWWIDRELHEAKAFLPSSKGGYRKQELNLV